MQFTYDGCGSRDDLASSFWTDGRQLLPYRITEGSPVNPGTSAQRHTRMSGLGRDHWSEDSGPLSEWVKCQAYGLSSRSLQHCGGPRHFRSLLSPDTPSAGPKDTRSVFVCDQQPSGAGPRRYPPPTGKRRGSDSILEVPLLNVSDSPGRSFRRKGPRSI
jgi:hypothetical protein